MSEFFAIIGSYFAALVICTVLGLALPAIFTVIWPFIEPLVHMLGVLVLVLIALVLFALG